MRTILRFYKSKVYKNNIKTTNQKSPEKEVNMELSQSDSFLSKKQINNLPSMEAALREITSYELPYSDTVHHDMRSALTVLADHPEYSEVKFANCTDCCWESSNTILKGVNHKRNKTKIVPQRNCDVLYGFSYPKNIRKIKVIVENRKPIKFSFDLNIGRGVTQHMFDEPLFLVSCPYSKISFEFEVDGGETFPMIVHYSIVRNDLRAEIMSSNVKWTGYNCHINDKVLMCNTRELPPLIKKKVNMEPSQNNSILSKEQIDNLPLIGNILRGMTSYESPYHDVASALMMMVTHSEYSEVRLAKHIKCHWKPVSIISESGFRKWNKTKLTIRRDCDLLYGFSYPNNIRKIRMTVRNYKEAKYAFDLNIHQEEGANQYIFDEPLFIAACPYSQISFEFEVDDKGTFPIIVHCSIVQNDIRMKLGNVKWDEYNCYINGGFLMCDTCEYELPVSAIKKKKIKYEYASSEDDKDECSENVQFIPMKPGVKGVYVYT